MKFEELGVIKYGNLRFIFKASEAVQAYLSEKGISGEGMFPKTQFFYQGVLMKTGIDYNDELDVDVVFHGMRLNGEGVTEILEGDYTLFDNFPIHDGDLVYFTDFGVEATPRQNEQA